MKYNGVIHRKLALLDRQVREIKKALDEISYTDFAASWEKRSMTERALQVSIEIIIDVADRIIAIEGAGPVASAAEAIENLVSLNIIESDKPYVDMVRFRNLIVHQYEDIDPALLFGLATTRLDDFRKFRNEIDSLP